MSCRVMDSRALSTGDVPQTELEHDVHRFLECIRSKRFTRRLS
jgi:hypothetical protein